MAFCIVSKVDGGATVVTRASRVHKQYEGLGLYKALTLFLQKYVFSDGTVTNDAVVYNDNNKSMLDKTSKGELTLLMKRVCIPMIKYNTLIKKIHIKVKKNNK